MTKNVCLFVGQFQPFHIGHLMVLKGMVKVCDRVVIGIGSSQAERSKEHPFTAAERRDMIQRALQDENIIPVHDVDFVEIPDDESDEEWTKTCFTLGEDITTVWTGNEHTKKCFEGSHATVQIIKEVPGISSSAIREKMISAGDWKSQVPKAVAEVVIEIDGAQRLRQM